jgi:hypothetical protein
VPPVRLERPVGARGRATLTWVSGISSGISGGISGGICGGRWVRAVGPPSALGCEGQAGRTCIRRGASGGSRASLTHGQDSSAYSPAKLSSTSSSDAMLVTALRGHSSGELLVGLVPVLVVVVVAVVVAVVVSVVVAVAASSRPSAAHARTDTGTRAHGATRRR